MFVRSLRATFGKSSRRFMSSEAAGPDPTQMPSHFERAKRFFVINRQPLLNVFAVWFTFYCVLHNRKVAVAWEAKQKEFDELEGRYKTLASAVVDEEWIKSVEAEVRGSKDAVLAKLVAARLEEVGVIQAAIEKEEAESKTKTNEVVPGVIKENGSGNKKQII